MRVYINKLIPVRVSRKERIPGVSLSGIIRVITRKINCSQIEFRFAEWYFSKFVTAENVAAEACSAIASHTGGVRIIVAELAGYFSLCPPPLTLECCAASESVESKIGIEQPPKW